MPDVNETTAETIVNSIEEQEMEEEEIANELKREQEMRQEYERENAITEQKTQELENIQRQIYSNSVRSFFFFFWSLFVCLCVMPVCFINILFAVCVYTCAS